MFSMVSTPCESSGAVRVALVSGCSSGIGNVTARRLARAGWIVFAGLRRSDRPTEARLAEEGLRPVPLDVTDAAQLRSAVDAVRGTAGRLDALVNNAGIDCLGALEDQPEEALRSVMEVNFFGAMALTRLALPLMRKAGRGTIVMVSSLSGLLGLPGSSAYCASKFALEGASEALRNEVSRFGIRVALIEPGGHATAMSGKRRLPANYLPSSPYLPMLEHLANSRPACADPAPLADLILAVIDSAAPQLRYAGGQQAQEVVARLATLDDCTRQRYARAVTDLGWWHNGKPRPDRP
jgi:NAD(P)-dependent dehydrogenase (short-subunit alcohol dehydrogenase family)